MKALELTEDQKRYVRETSTRKTIASMAIECRASRHTIIAFIMEEKLSIKIKKKQYKKPKQFDPLDQYLK